MEPESDETNEQLAIELLSRAKTYLDAMPTNLQPQEYQKIIELVNNYIEKNCKHKIIDDSIDVGYEQSRTIRYCELCLKTFN
jgi:serine protease inhibitor